MAPFAFVTGSTSYVLLCGFGFVLGLGMGLAMMPTMTAAMQAVPPAAIARTSTAMNIIRQGGASIGTAIISVLLASAIVDKLPRAAGAEAGSGFEALHSISTAQREAVANPLAEAFASTFVWAIALLALAMIPALWMALASRKSPKSRTPSPAEPASVLE